MHDRKGDDLRERFMGFALRVIRLFTALPKTAEAQVIGRQFLQSGTSGPAQHREGHRARSDAEFVSKLESATQEMEETDFWLELLLRARIVSEGSDAADLRRECGELIAILVSSVNTVKSRKC